ncbi:MAG TPA: hypothetical protein VGE45_00335 [Chloroflexia bacterium]
MTEVSVALTAAAAIKRKVVLITRLIVLNVLKIDLQTLKNAELTDAERPNKHTHVTSNASLSVIELGAQQIPTRSGPATETMFCRTERMSRLEAVRIIRLTKGSVCARPRTASSTVSMNGPTGSDIQIDGSPATTPDAPDSLGVTVHSQQSSGNS